jgi:hypothetical protein
MSGEKTVFSRARGGFLEQNHSIRIRFGPLAKWIILEEKSTQQ